MAGEDVQNPTNRNTIFFLSAAVHQSKAKTPENTGLRNVFFFNVVTFANNKLHVYSVNIS